MDELRRSSQVKKDRDLTLKVLESDGSDSDDEEIAIIARKVKKTPQEGWMKLQEGKYQQDEEQ